jgi:hypothetical protein
MEDLFFRIVLPVFNFLFLGIISLGVYIFKKQDSKVEKIEKNYINRFDDNASDHTEIKVLLSEVKAKLDILLEERKNKK